MARPSRCSPEVRGRAARLVMEQRAGAPVRVVEQQPLTVESKNAGSRREALGQAVSSARVIALVDVAQAAADFLGQRDEIGGDWLAGHHPMLVAGQSLISVSAPGQSRLDGATLRDVVDAIKRGGR